ncbi:hypothetical protein HanIR_Chr08g0378541 [Helianthus annuus]|nr:hypothetical protein HanIR_Chr08g0378541 [Helianthus annuus]
MFMGTGLPINMRAHVFICNVADSGAEVLPKCQLVCKAFKSIYKTIKVNPSVRQAVIKSESLNSAFGLD